MITIIKTLAVLSIVGSFILVYSSVVTYFLINDDKKNDKQSNYDDEDFF